MNSVESLWSALSAGPDITGTFRRVDDAHPLDLFAGFDLDSRRVLMLITDKAPIELPIPGLIEVSLTQRNDGRFNLLFRLGRPEYEELFGRLCQDLIESSRESDPESGTSLLLLRLDRWKRLLESGPRRGLTEHQLQGLFGELWFLKTVAIPSVGAFAAVQAWKGPLGAPQDFQIFDGMIEIKTILAGAHWVSISSAEQLEHGNAPMQLGVFTVDATHGLSVPALIEQIRLQLESSSVATEFELRLAEMGYSVRQEHDRLLFTVINARYYVVDEDFPSLKVSTLPLGVSNVTYDLDLLQCGSYRSQYTHVAG
jgi:hypothetical protein